MRRCVWRIADSGEISNSPHTGERGGFDGRRTVGGILDSVDSEPDQRSQETPALSGVARSSLADEQTQGADDELPRSGARRSKLWRFDRLTQAELLALGVLAKCVLRSEERRV